MTTLKRLISREWLSAFFASVFVFILLITVANVVSELLRSVTTLPDILLNNFLEMPKWLNKILPIACLTATLFSLNRLQRKGELMAIFACGFPRFSFFTLILQLSFLVAVSEFLISSYLQPYADALKFSWLRDGGIHFRGNKSQSLQTSTSSTGKVWYRNDLYYASFLAFDKQRSELRDLTLFFYDSNYKLERIITADRARTATSSDGSNSYKWTLSTGNELNSLKDKNFPQKRVFDTLNLDLKEKPADFLDVDLDINKMDIHNLYYYILKIKKLGINACEYEVMFYEKFSSSIICIIFAFISVGAIFNPNRRHSSFGKNIFFVMIFTTVFWPSYSSFMDLAGGSKLPPLWATFAIPALCSLYILIYFYKHRRLA
ncbi:MAG: LptF/LptG family permease [Oligoflexia bacterium]|nr:LptF/LptG family permease [Oligoflexia bacterium]